MRLILLLSAFVGLFTNCSAQKGKNAAPVPASIYDFKVEGLEGNIIDFSNFRGKKILIVNTASKCGNTPQYEGLEALYKAHPDQLVIIGFPANDFMWQEPGSNQEIAEFCQRNYGVTFPMAAKVSVKGQDMAPIYQWLTQKKHNHFKDSAVKWNFQKYLIDENGNLVAVISPSTRPEDDEVTRALGL